MAEYTMDYIVAQSQTSVMATITFTKIKRRNMTPSSNIMPYQISEGRGGI